MDTKNKQPTVFLSYSLKDSEIAMKINNALIANNITVESTDLVFRPEDSVPNRIREVISASDYLVILLSPNFIESSWLQYELDVMKLLKELNSRDITLIPVLIAETEIPKSIRKYQYLDCSKNFEKSIKKLAKQIDAAPEIDFSRLDYFKFENLVIDLLSKLKFKNIERHVRENDFEFDIKAYYLRTDPFGMPIKETWFTECKFYKQSRADVKTIEAFLFTLAKLEHKNCGLLITNSQLTSAAQSHLEHLNSVLKKDVRIIDSTELKSLLLKYNDLIKKYFSADEEIES
ncbi:MAG TPA: TIR domain-containing protein [Pyrinomonadaceae bacterium]|jgi:hypothetical protein